MAYVSPQALGDVEQQNISFYADTTARTKQVVVFPSKRRAKGNADGHKHTGTGPGGCIFYQSALFGQ